MVECSTEGLQVRVPPGHCIVSLSKTCYPLLSTGSAQEDRPDMTKMLAGAVKNHKARGTPWYNA